jgi:signal transduction histidine kinase
MEEQVIRVLLVEDDEDDYILIRDLLSQIQERKYVLDWVKSYEQALTKMSYDDSHVCLMDYRLGAHDGLEVLRKARERGAHMPVIFVTGREDYHVDMHAMKSGALDYLVKSQLSGPLLDRSIRYAIERWRSEEELRSAYEEMETRVQERTADLASANAALQRSAEEIKLFAYSIAHDLKNPVSAIHGLVKRLAEQSASSLDEKGKEYCRHILRSSEQIVELVEKIYTYISAKESPLSIETIALKEVIQAIREEFDNQINERRIEWFEPESAPQIQVDKLALLRIFRNLVENALKYGGEKLSEIRVGYRDEGDFHVISVRDNGAGLQDLDSEKIFSVFVRSRDAKSVKGAGLGLAIVKELVMLHKGKVWAEPGREAGATFFVSFPKNPQSQS